MKNIILIALAVFPSCKPSTMANPLTIDLCNPKNAKVYVSITDVNFQVIGDDALKIYDLGIIDTSSNNIGDNKIKFIIPEARERFGIGFKPCNLPENIKNGMFVKVSGISYKDSNTFQVPPDENPLSPVSLNGGLPLKITKLEMLQ